MKNMKKTRLLYVKENGVGRGFPKISVLEQAQASFPCVFFQYWRNCLSFIIPRKGLEGCGAATPQAGPER
jgi:hypothetical protein